MQLDQFSIIDTIRKKTKKPRKLIPQVRRDPYHLLTRQKSVFKQLKGSDRLILQCPTGWGKSIVIQFLAIFSLCKNRKQKIIIIVPQNMIGSGFNESRRLNVPGMTEQRWSIISDLTINSVPNKSKVLTRFIKREVGSDDSMTSRIILTTHSAFVRVAEKLPASDFDNITVAIDECHHVRCGELETTRDDVRDEATFNRLGNLLPKLLAAKNSGIWLTTATFGRGDGETIVPPELLNKFAFYKVDFDKYLGSLDHLRGFSKSFLIYNPEDQLAGLRYLCETQKKTLVYCPPMNGRFLHDMPKKEFIGQVHDILSNSDSTLWKPGSTSGNWIIDLTNGRNRDDKIRVLRDSPESVAAVLAVGRMKEGADWPALERTVDFAPSMNSMTLRIQKLGRGIRDFKGKEFFEYFTCLPKIDKKDDEQIREACSEYFSALVASLIDLSYYNGDFVWRTHSKSEGALTTKQRTQIIESAMKYVLHSNKNQTLDDALKFATQHLDLSDKQMKGIQASLQTLLMQQSKTIRDTPWIQKCHPSFINDLGFDDVQSEDIASGMKLFCAQACGVDTFTRMRKVLTSPVGLKHFQNFEQGLPQFTEFAASPKLHSAIGLTCPS